MIRWIVSSALAVIFLLLTLVNGYYLWIQCKKNDGVSPSLAPLLGGIAGIIAVLVAPVGHMPMKLWWILVPVFADAGTGYYIIGGSIYAIGKRLKRK